MFICSYYFPATEGNNVPFEKVIEKIEANVGDVSGKKVVLTSETREGIKLETIEVPAGTFLHKALVDYYKNSEIEAEFKMVFYTNKYQISEISKAVDNGATASICKKLDDMNLYRVSVA